MPSAILDPTGLTERPAAEGLTLAPRPAELSGVKIGLLENGKQNARPLLEEIAGVLRERYAVGEATIRRKDVFAAPAPPELVDEMSARCDVVITGVGDCGSCSASAVADGILFERHGTPAAVICSDAFRTTAGAMAEVQGAPGYDYITTPHPVAGLGPEEIHERAEAVAAEVAKLLAGSVRRGV